MYSENYDTVTIWLMVQCMEKVTLTENDNHYCRLTVEKRVPITINPIYY